MIQGRKSLPRLALLAIAGLTLIQSGCLWVAVGAGAAAGCAAGYAYLKGEVPQTYIASFDDTWNAAQTSLTELGMPVVSVEKKTNKSGTIHTQLGNGDAVALQIDEEPGTFPADGSVTRVGVRVAMMGDYPVSDRILNQIGAHLVAPGAVSRGPGNAVVPVAGTQPAPGTNAVVPATWTGVPSGTTPPPPLASTNPGTTPITPANPAATPASRPMVGFPASTPPPPLATPDPETKK